MHEPWHIKTKKQERRNTNIILGQGKFPTTDFFFFFLLLLIFVGLKIVQNNPERGESLRMYGQEEHRKISLHCIAYLKLIIVFFI